MIGKINTSNFQTNQIKQNEKLLYKAQKQVASGKKINTAADDAAGLSISQKLLKEAKTLSTKSSNYSSQVNYNNIADGAYAGISDTYNDMYQNSIRALNGTMSDSDLKALKQVNDAYQASTGHIAGQAKYNGKQTVDNIDISYNSLDSEAISNASQSVAEKRSKVGAETVGLEHAISAADISAENTVAALSREEDAEMEKAVSAYKKQQTIGQFQNMLLREQMSTADGLVKKLF